MGYELGPAMLLLEDSTSTTASMNSSITDSDTTIGFTDTSGLPDRGVVQIESEEVLYLENDTTNNQLKQCIRGFRGTTAASHDGSTSAITCDLLFKDLGKTQGGVRLTLNESYQPLNTDQDGDQPVDESQVGLEVRVTAALADITMENLAMAHKLTVQGTSGSRRIEFGSGVGRSLLSNAKKLLIVPYENGSPSSDVEDLYTLPKAGMKAVEELVYDVGTQRVINVEFVGYPDPSSGYRIIRGKEA